MVEFQYIGGYMSIIRIYMSASLQSSVPGNVCDQVLHRQTSRPTTSKLATGHSYPLGRTWENQRDLARFGNGNIWNFQAFPA